MRILQMIFCILACLCVLAAAILGAFLRDLAVVLGCAAGAVAFAAAMFAVKAIPERRREREARAMRRDFMDTPEDAARKQSADKKDGE